MKGRLNRESNPVPGEKPGFLPQHESETSGEFVVTGERNPYPVKIKNTDEQAIPVKLTGSNVVLVSESNFTRYEAGASRYFDVMGDFKSLLIAYRGTATKVSIGAVSINVSNNFGQGVVPFAQKTSNNLSNYFGNYMEIPMLSPNKTRVYVRNDDTSARDIAVIILGRR